MAVRKVYKVQLTDGSAVPAGNLDEDDLKGDEGFNRLKGKYIEKDDARYDADSGGYLAMSKEMQDKLDEEVFGSPRNSGLKAPERISSEEGGSLKEDVVDLTSEVDEGEAAAAAAANSSAPAAKKRKVE